MRLYSRRRPRDLNAREVRDRIWLLVIILTIVIAIVAGPEFGLLVMAFWAAAWYMGLDKSILTEHAGSEYVLAKRHQAS